MPDFLNIISLLVLVLILLFINSKEIFGFYYACKEETEEHDAEILWWLHTASRIYLGEKWTKPVCGCVICMSSFHSFLIWIPVYIIAPFSFAMIYFHCIYICALAGFNYLITADKKYEL